MAKKFEYDFILIVSSRRKGPQISYSRFKIMTKLHINEKLLELRLVDTSDVEEMDEVIPTLWAEALRIEDAKYRAATAHAIANLYFKAEDWTNSEFYARLAVEHQETLGGILLGNHLLFLVRILQKHERDDQRENINLVKRALKIYETELGPTHSEVRYISSWLDMLVKA